MWSWWKRAGVKRRRSELSAYMDEGSEIEGTFTFSGTAMLNGRFKGEIRSRDTLIVGETGVVNANVSAGTVLISGEVVGNVSATERLELHGRARIFGDIEAPILVIEEGALFEGNCRMTKARPEPTRDARDLSVLTFKR